MKHPIEARQAAGLLLVVLTGWSLTMSAADGRDGWIALLLAGALSLPLTAVCCLPAERVAAQRWFDLPRMVFGATGSTVYLLLLSALAFWSLCMAVLDSVIFLRTVSGDIWPVWLLTAALLLCAACTAQNGVRRLVLWAQPVVWVAVLALAVSLLLSLRQLDGSQLFPVFQTDWPTLSMRSYLLLSAPFAEVFYAAAVLGGTQSRSIRSGLLRACVLASIVLALLYLRNIALLGAQGAQAVPYPSYTSASVLSFGESFQRGEALISGSLIVCAVARAALMLNFLSGSVCAVGRFRPRAVVWCAAVAAAVVCVLCAGIRQTYADALQLYRCILLPAVLAAAAALLIGTYVWQRRRKNG